VQEQYFLRDTEKAQVVLKKYLDLTVEFGSSCCQACHQSCAKDETMMVCVGCLVTRYCSQAHQRRAWKKGRLCHKVMCPLLKRWRRLQNGEYTTDSCNAIFNDFFESIVADLWVLATPRSDASEIEAQPFKCEEESIGNRGWYGRNIHKSRLLPIFYTLL